MQNETEENRIKKLEEQVRLLTEVLLIIGNFSTLKNPPYDDLFRTMRNLDKLKDLNDA